MIFACLIEKKSVKQQLCDLLSQYDIKKIAAGAAHPDITEKTNIFLMAKKMEGLSERTLLGYRKTIGKFGGYINKPVNQITSDDIRQWLSGCSDCNMSTIRYYLSVIRSFYEFLLVEEFVSIDPTRKIKTPKIKKQIPVALSVEEIEVLRDGCVTLRDMALLETLFSTGCRIDEIYKTNKYDIDWKNRTILVTGKGNKERIVFFNARAAHALKKYLKSRNDQLDALFITGRGGLKRLSQRSMFDVIKKIAKRTTVTKNVHPHIFRSSFVKAMLDRGARVEDVQAILGHASPNTTLGYGKVSVERAKQAYNQHFAN